MCCGRGEGRWYCNIVCVVKILILEIYSSFKTMKSFYFSIFIFMDKELKTHEIITVDFPNALKDFPKKLRILIKKLDDEETLKTFKE